MRRESIVVAVALLVCAACGDDGGTTDAGPTDARLECMAGEGPLEMGRCVRDDGSGCTGCEVGTRYEGVIECALDLGVHANFTPLTAGDEVNMMMSPYGSYIIWLAARTPGLVDVTAGSLEIRVIDRVTGEEVAMRRFEELVGLATEMPDGAVVPLLEVIPEPQPMDELLGHELTALTRLSVAGEVRCGTGTMRVGRYVN